MARRFPASLHSSANSATTPVRVSRPAPSDERLESKHYGRVRRGGLRPGGFAGLQWPFEPCDRASPMCDRFESVGDSQDTKPQEGHPHLQCLPDSLNHRGARDARIPSEQGRQSPGYPASASADSRAWLSMIFRSSGSSRPGLSRISSGTPTFPTSCRSPGKVQAALILDAGSGPSPERYRRGVHRHPEQSEERCLDLASRASEQGNEDGPKEVIAHAQEMSPAWLRSAERSTSRRSRRTRCGNRQKPCRSVKE